MAINGQDWDNNSWLSERARVGAHLFSLMKQRGWTEDELLEHLSDFSDGSAEEEFNGLSEDEFEDKSDDIFFRYAHAYTWFRSGLPRVVIGEKLAASLCATRVPPECVEHVKMPWPSFVIDLPMGLLGWPGQYAKHVCVSSTRGERWEIDAKFPLADGNMGTKAISRLSVTSASEICEEAEDAIKDPDSRINGMGMRFVLGVMIEMNEYRASKAPKVGGSRTYAARKGDLRSTIVRLTRDVKVDCRQHVRDYIAGASGKTLSVQHMVRGHWKMQTHGEKSSQRKFIHVEPYWRGPDDAPIALRNHVLTGDSHAKAANDG